MRKPESGVNRRKFLSNVAVAGAAAGATVVPPAASAPPVAGSAKLPEPSMQQLAAETTAPPAAEEGPFVDRPGSDYMVDVIKSLKIDYVAALAGSSFRGLHESLITYGGNKAPEFITCLHEEISVSLAHGYAKVTGKPMAAMVHSTVGLQHAAMAVYNAWCDRVPIVVIVGAALDATKRRPGVEWMHSVQDGAAMLRDCTKWDDQPVSLAHFGESFVRAYRLAVTPPMGPVMIMVDGELQEHPMEGAAPPIPHLSLPTPPQGDTAAVAEAARLLAAAENPVIVADRLVRTESGMARLIELAELLCAPVVDRLSRLNFPSDHDLCLSEQAGGLIRQADVVLGLEAVDFWGLVNQLRDVPGRDYRSVVGDNTKLIHISTGGDLYGKSNYQDFQRYAAVDLDIAGDGEATLPALIEAVRRALPRSRRAALAARRERLTKMHKDMRERSRADALYAWDASPVSTARLHAELWPLIRNEDWALVSDTNFQSNWPHRMWNFTKPYQYIGGAGGAGVGYSPSAPIGAALAHRDHGRFVINIQGDGELMCTPGALWTAAHHKIPLLNIMHNNRAYHQEVMHLQRMAGQRQRGIDRAHIGTRIEDPNIDYAKLAQSLGMQAIGPVTDPSEYAAALKRGIAIVKSGEPAMIDVVCQPR